MAKITAPAKRLPPPPPELPAFAPRVPPALALNGELSEELWRTAAHSGGFTDEATGKLAIPHSELRAANDGARILLGLYAADEDIHAVPRPGQPLDPGDDSFSVVLQRVSDGPAYQFEISAAGTLRESLNGAPVPTAGSHAACAVEMDGTANHPADDDEEWVAECIVPFALPGVRIGDTLQVTVRRCDTPKGAGRRCASWHRRVQVQ